MSAKDKICLLCPPYCKIKGDEEVVHMKCSHTFCWTCLDNYLIENMDKQIKCPAGSCVEIVNDNVIRKILSPQNIERYERLCFADLEQSHRCLLPRCDGIILYSDPNIQYQCQMCTLFNCIPCAAAHTFNSCSRYKSLPEISQRRLCDEEMARATEVLKGIQRQKMREILLHEDDEDVLLNENVFACCLCCTCVGKGQGVKLRDCSHQFCRRCLSQHIISCSTVEVRCPRGCARIISDREIQHLLSENEMKIYQSKCNLLVKRNTSNCFQCMYPNCDSFYYYKERPKSFQCTKCRSLNCVTCGTVHEHESCAQYRIKMESNNDSRCIEENIKLKKMMKCPDCGHLLCKVAGCNWIRCDKCLVELCWIRQMHRWGPKGRGDASGGCGCGVLDKMCHVDCSGCIPDR